MDLDVLLKMKTYLTTLMAMLLLTVSSVAENLTVEMPLDQALKVLKQANAKQRKNMYHFPWATVAEIKEPMKDGEDIEAYLERIRSKLEKKPQKHGYSIFFILSDNTQLELVLVVDGDSKRIKKIQLGESKKVYEGKLEWINAHEEGKIKKLKSLELKKQNRVGDGI